jgi:hypothetical protein
VTLLTFVLAAAATLGQPSTDMQVAKRAAAILSTPASWNQTDRQDCAADAKTFSIYCALAKAQRDVTGTFDRNAHIMDDARDVIDFMSSKDYGARLVGYNNDPETTFVDVQAFFHILMNRITRRQNAPPVSGPPATGPSPCELHADGATWKGSCDHVVGDKLPLELTREPAVTTGVWKRDATPASVWADVASPAGARNDLEIEIYADGSGVMRSPDGWFPVSGFAADSGVMRFTVNSDTEVAPNAVDREILVRAATVITSDAVWNRHDDRQCAAVATTWSLYCAVEKASREVTGGFHHRRPAMQLVREVIERRTKDKQYRHREMDYNNDPATTLADVKSLFAEALKRITVPGTAGP